MSTRLDHNKVNRAEQGARDHRDPESKRKRRRPAHTLPPPVPPLGGGPKAPEVIAEPLRPAQNVDGFLFSCVAPDDT